MNNRKIIPLFLIIGLSITAIYLKVEQSMNKNQYVEHPEEEIIIDVDKTTTTIPTTKVEEPTEINYKTVNTAEEYFEYINQNKTIMTVFGRTSCSWCTLYKGELNKAAKEYNNNIVYIDAEVMDHAEYVRIMNSDLYIPAECSSNNKKQNLSDGFGTPLTLFTTDGKVTGCAKSYLGGSDLISLMEKQKMKKMN